MSEDRQFKAYVETTSTLIDELRHALHSADQHKIQHAVDKLYSYNCMVRDSLGLGPYTHRLQVNDFDLEAPEGGPQ